MGWVFSPDRANRPHPAPRKSIPFILNRLRQIADIRLNMRYGLRLKIVVLAVAAPVALGQVALRFVDRTVEDHVRSTTDENLRRSALVCENVLISRSRTLEASAQAIAQDPRFLSSLTLPANYGPRTVLKTSRDLSKIAKVDLFEVLDRKGLLVASIGAGTSTAKSRRPLLDLAMKKQGPVAALEVNGAALYHVVASPVPPASGKGIAILILGERIDSELAGELKALTRCEVSFFIGEKEAASTLQPGPNLAVLAAAVKSHLASDQDLTSANVAELNGAAGTYLTLMRRVPGAGKNSKISFVIQRSLDEDTAFLGAIHAGLAKQGGLIALAALILGILVSYRITRPVLDLVRGVEEMERGNYEYPIKVRDTDEIGYLTKRFREIREHERVYVSSLEEASRLKSEFLNVASHELRTPASIIKAYGELLAEGRLGPISGEQKKALGIIDQQLDGIGRIIDDVAWLSQVEGERRTLDLTVLPVQEIIEVAVEEATNDAEGRQQHITIEIDPNADRVTVDGPRLEHALANLVRNAIRYTPDGGHVSIRARREAADLVIEVRDSGIGIASDKKQHLFDRSFMLRDSLQHHSSRTLEFNSAGIGLGLPLARGIIEAHGGTISVESEMGQGSTFTVRIPAHYSAHDSADSADDSADDSTALLEAA